VNLRDPLSHYTTYRDGFTVLENEVAHLVLSIGKRVVAKVDGDVRDGVVADNNSRNTRRACAE
jgi:hypothetical protein